MKTRTQIWLIALLTAHVMAGTVLASGDRDSIESLPPVAALEKLPISLAALPVRNREVSRWDLMEWQFPEAQNLDDLAAQYFQQDSIPNALKDVFPFLKGQAFDLQKRAQKAFAELGDFGEMINRLAGLERLKFPVGMSYGTESMKVDVVIESIEYSGALAIMHNVFLRLTIEQYPPLIFGSPEVSFSRTGGFREAKVGLIGDMVLPIGGSSDQVLILRGYDHRTDRGTMATISCDGFESIQMAAAAFISRRLIRPVNASGQQLAGFVQGDLSLNVTDLTDFTTTVSFNQDFMVGTNSKVIFSVREMVFDASEIRTESTINFPTNYFGGEDPEFGRSQWQGFFMGEVGFKLNKLTGANAEDNFGGIIRNLIVDRSGVTGALEAFNPLTLDKGRIGSWRFSVDDIMLKLYKSNFEELGVKGRLVPPVLDDGTDKSAIGYAARVIDSDWLFAADITGSEEHPFPLFKDRVHLYTGTTIQVGYSEVTDERVVQLTLHGAADLDKVWAKNDGTDSGSDPITFQGLHVQSVTPYIKNIGVWDIPLQRSFGFGPFTFSLNNVQAGMNEKQEVQLYFEGGAGFSGDDGFNISSTVGVSIIGDYDEEQEGRLVYDRTEVDKVGLCIATKAWGAKVELHWFEGDGKYGNGFAGRAAIALSSMGYEPSDDICEMQGGIFASALFGNVDSMRYYNMELLYMDLEGGIPMGPLAIHAIGGSVSNHMRPTGIYDLDFEQVNPADTAKAQSSQNQGESMVVNESLGSSMLGLHFTPDEDSGFGIRLMTIMASEGSSEIFNMNALLTFQFNAVGGGLDSIALDVDGQMMATLGLKKIMEFETPVYFNARMVYNHIDKIFLLNANVAFNFENAIVGGGHLTIYRDPVDWYVHVGWPGDPNNLSLKVPSIGLHTHAYFCAGSTQVPDMPPLPVQIRNTFSGESNDRTFDVNSSLSGMAFGAHLNLGSAADQKFLVFYYRFHVLLGLDVNIRNYVGYACGDDPTFGVNQWYGKGQVYAYLDGAVGLQAAGKTFPILELMAAFKIYLETPNPTYGEFGLMVKYKVLGGLIKGRAKIEASFGDRCDLTKNSLDINVFDEVIQPSNDQNLNVTQDITFSSGVPFYKVFPDDLGNSKFRVDLREQQVSGTEAFAFYMDGNGTEQQIPCSRYFTEDNTFVTYVPDGIWPANTEVYLKPRAHFVQSANGGAWSPVKDAMGKTSQDTIYRFSTGPYPDYIPSYNIEYAYPRHGMTNYYPEQLQWQGQYRGVFKLRKRMDAFFNGLQFEAIVECHDDPTRSFRSPCSFDISSGIVSWEMPPSRLKHEGLYTIRFESDGKAITDDIQFRVSKFNRFEDKVRTYFQNGSAVPQPGLDSMDLHIDDEPFDGHELASRGQMNPMVSVSYDISPLNNTIAYLNQGPQVISAQVSTSDLDMERLLYIHNNHAIGSAYQTGDQVMLQTSSETGVPPVYQLTPNFSQSLLVKVHQGYFYNVMEQLGSMLTPNEVEDMARQWKHPSEVRLRWQYSISPIFNYDITTITQVQN